MKYLSVREEKAAQIVKDLTGRDAEVTLDPTLLLERKEWEQVVKNPTFDMEENYICTYFFGEVPEAVERFAVKKGMKIYPLNDPKAPDLFICDPDEFLHMIKMHRMYYQKFIDCSA